MKKRGRQPVFFFTENDTRSAGMGGTSDAENGWGGAWRTVEPGVLEVWVGLLDRCKPRRLAGVLGTLSDER